MKTSTSKRKRSTKAAPGVDTPVAAPIAELDGEAGVEATAVIVEVASESVVAEFAGEPVAVATEVEVAVAQPVAVTSPEPIVVLAANCSVKDAAALKTSLCAFATASSAVTLDASAVERVDTATMQLLCAFVRDRGTRNQNVVWRGESHALQDAARLLGVGAMLGFEEAKGVAA